MTEKEAVHHPQHYGGDVHYEVIKIIDDWGLGFSLGNALKYILRAAHKGAQLEDLRKARWYLDHAREIGEVVTVRHGKRERQPLGVSQYWKLSTHLVETVAHIDAGNLRGALHALQDEIERVSAL